MRRASAALIAALAAASAACSPHPPVEDAGTVRRLEEAAARSFDEAALRRSLDAMAAWHAKNGSSLRLRPGLTDAEIDARTARLPFRLPEDVRALYRWRDGAEPGSAGFFFNMDFPPLERAIRSWRRWRWHPAWGRDWFPLFTFQGEAFFVACGGLPVRSAPIRHFFLQDTHHRLAFSGLTPLARFAAQGMRSRAVAWKDGAAAWDVRALAPIHARLNPGASFPYHVP